MRTWVHRVTIKAIVDLQKTSERGLADSIYECIGAWRYFEAIEQFYQGNHTTAIELASKVRTDKFTSTEMLLRVQARIGTTYRQQDPFTDTCVAAHQQQRDWEKLSTGQHTPEQYDRIKARHEMYRLCQPELNPQEEAA